MKKVKEKLNKLLEKTILNDLFICDSLFLLGFLIIIIANFFVNKLFGTYFLALALIAFSVFLNKSTKK